MRPRIVASCVLLPLLVVALRMSFEGRAALREADELAADAGPFASRVEALGRAARRFGGPSDQARARLAALGRAGEASAWEELRSSILATRWLVTPDHALLAEANRAIAARRAAEVLARAGTTEPAQLRAQQQAQLARLMATGEPNRALSLLAIFGLVVFVAAVGHALFRGRSSLVLACAALGLCCLVVGVWRA